MAGKRNRIGYLRSAQDRFLLRRVRGAFLAVVGALSCRPEPRSAWDNAARDENPADPKGWDAVVAGQIAMKAALATGDVHVIEETANRVRHYGEELTAAMLAPYLERMGGSVECALVDASRETHEALHFLTLAGLRPRCRATLDRAAREAREAIARLRTWTDTAERDLVSAVPAGKHATGARG